MLCARVMRGINSSANAVTPRDAISRTVSGDPSGSAMAMTTCPWRICAKSLGAHLQNDISRKYVRPAGGDLRALLLVRAVGKTRALACAALDHHLEPGFFQRGNRRGHERHAPLAGKLFNRHSDLHDGILCMLDFWFRTGSWLPPVNLTIALAQLNPTVGDIDGNLARIRRARDRAAADGADLVVLPELALIGYPPEDLVLRPSVVDACHAAIDCLVRESHAGPALVATTPWREDGHVYNAAIVIDKGATTRRFKSDLPNYGVFDEKRVFTAGPLPEPVNFRGVPDRRAGLRRHLDARHHRAPGARRGRALHRAERLSVRDRQVSDAHRAGPRAHARDQPRARLRQPGRRPGRARVRRPVVRSQPHGRPRAARWPAGKRRIELTRWTRDVRRMARARQVPSTRRATQLADTYSALMTGLRDYVEKNGFPGLVLGLSGGVDSALSAAVGVDALGRRARAGRAAAVAVHRRRQHGRSAVRRGPSRHPAPDAADRAADGERRSRRWRRFSKAGRAMSPRKIFRRGFADFS